MFYRIFSPHFRLVPLMQNLANRVSASLRAREKYKGSVESTVQNYLINKVVNIIQRINICKYSYIHAKCIDSSHYKQFSFQSVADVPLTNLNWILTHLISKKYWGRSVLLGAEWGRAVVLEAKWVRAVFLEVKGERQVKYWKTHPKISQGPGAHMLWTTGQKDEIRWRLKTRNTQMENH